MNRQNKVFAPGVIGSIAKIASAGSPGVLRKAPGIVGRLILPASFALLVGSSTAGVAAGLFEGKPSGNQQVMKQEQVLLNKLQKGTEIERSDAYYDAGNTAFENGDYGRAEYYLRESLAIEKTLKRPLSLVASYVALGHVLAVQKKYQEAKTVYQTGLTFAEDHGFPEEAQSIINSMGVMAEQLRNWDEAETYHKIAFEMAGKQQNVETQVNALTNQITIARKRKNYQKAYELGKQAVELAAKNEMTIDGKTFGNALLHYGHACFEVGKFEESNQAYLKAIEHFKEELENVLVASACYHLSENFYDFHDTDQARKYALLAVENLKDEAPSADLIRCYIDLGGAEADLGSFDEAKKAHSKALNLAQKLGNRQKEIEAHMHLGNDFLLQGFPEAALSRLMTGQKLLDAGIPPHQRASYLIGIGRCYKQLGDYKEAMKYYEAALKLYQEDGEKEREALTYNTMSVLALDQNKHEEYQKYSDGARAIYRELDNKRELAILDYNLAQHYLMQKRAEDARNMYLNALAKIQQTEDAVTEGRIKLGLGLTELWLDNPKKGLEYLQDAWKVAEKGGSIEAKWECLLAMGKCRKKLEQYDLAQENLKEAVNLVEQERVLLTRDSFKMHTLDLRRDCFDELIDLYVKLGKPYEALEIAEKGRARAFLDMLASRRAGADKQIRMPLAFGGQQPQSDSGQRLAMAKPAEAGSRAVTALPRPKVLTENTYSLSPVYAEAPKISEIQTLVKKAKGWVVQYFLAPKKLIIWVVAPDSTIHSMAFALADEALEKKVQDLHEAITEVPKSKEQLAAITQKRQLLQKDLYLTIVAPIEQYLPKDANELVTIVPHGVLFQVPFAALMAPDGKFLVEKHTLNYTPAIGVMRATQRIDELNRGKPDRLLAFGNPITKENAILGALPYAEKEVKNIATLFGAEKSVVMTGAQATRDTFERLASQFTDVHLATHGMIDEENPMDSALVMAPSATDSYGLLTVKDILAMRELQARLVVLSACQTGRGRITGDGVVGLSRAFIIAGSPSVMVSQWNVDDIMTEYQMKRFYESYLKGVGKAKSLREAQIATIKFMEGGTGLAPGARANPRYWAAFQLIGEAI